MLELGGEESSRRAEAGAGLAGWHYLPRWTTGLRGNRTRRGAGVGGRRNPLTSARKVQALCPVCSASWRRTVRLTGCVTSGHLRHLSASVSLLVKWGGGNNSLYS